ncbi:hypothetical protein [Syntrophaceticus schinkii]|uniref:Uncharacterized protein n=1 Tax=Syntrophaceticus schinkii TaxID=499207 RepID=A0A0B7MAQ7_9FIRM|nr:hypothetical protein [Syntrophaceticus schinkii]CEO87599.1 conserved hypothetical protein [Syntrophaceticus schinkii]
MKKWLTNHQWNRAITDYFLQGLPVGSSVYLSLDYAALQDISQRLTIIKEGQRPWADDFLLAVRSYCIRNGTVNINLLKGTDQKGLPRCVGFLGAMVLAAYLMMDEETEDGLVSESNYFTRFQSIIGLNGNGRPASLNPPGKEVQLWKLWNQYLLKEAYLPTAKPGDNVPRRYINYPLSQALLRMADRERMERVLRREERNGRLSKVLDIERISIWLQSNAQHFGSRHIRELLHNKDRQRYQAFCEAVYELYTTIDWTQNLMENVSVLDVSHQRRLTAGLYRVEDPFESKIEYLIYPQEPRRYDVSDLKIYYQGEQHSLTQERKGWYFPLWAMDPTGGYRFEVLGDTLIKELIIPEKGFWILRRDPENQESGVFASWGYPELGETFLLLCHKDYEEQVELLGQENLLKWDHSIYLTGKLSDWIEYRECMVVSQNWENIVAVKNDLFEALRPSFQATISLTNGLRLPPKLRWFTGYEPEITVIAFNHNVDLLVTELGNDENIIFRESVVTNQPNTLPSLPPGNYLARVFEEHREIATKTFQIVGWGDIQHQKVAPGFGTQLGKYTVVGASILEKP